ncbi:hypothetical protein Halha_2128 [Halobacteroides halobius DSM 5150]|uniref:Uncharacterized protein n=1 Tax=Halobacteroides halobius (strain ATCC 35273 / DSM 5150 / MD-1) TaxID=748449 RepID=L0KAG9_HALHC|nr:hypothetical protein [Halobacteroides halobius]AGB42011.1 hypothetical protein Halha_2128 [Halobacteroides halobius DSM 5150]
MSTWSLLKKSYKEIYKHIFSVLWASFTWFFTAGALIAGIIVGIEAKFLLVPALLASLFVGPTTAGSFYITNKIANYEQVGFKDFFIGIKRYFLPAVGVTLVLSLAVIVIGIDFKFFLDSEFKLFGYYILKLVSPMWIYVLVFISVLTMYIFPLLIEFERIDKEFSFLDLFKYSFFLTLKELKYTLVIFLNIIIFSAVSGALVIGLPILFMGGISLFANNATVNLLVKYGVKEKMNGPGTF